VDRLAIAAAVAAIEDESHHRKIVEEVIENRTELAAQLEQLEFAVSPSSANFVLVKPPPGISASTLSARLRERKILVRHYDREPIAGWIRITVGTREQHDKLVAALKEVL
jgi:histidinol-phosphate aminotransferase